MAALPKKPGDITGCHWRGPHPDPGKLRHVMIDVNYWKTTLHQQLGTPLGQSGCFAVYGDKRTDHGMWADHLTAENPHLITNETKGEQRTIVEWVLKPNRENETLDCVAGCFAAASIEGAELRGAVDPGKERGRKRFNMSSYNQ
jgi:phage terminase large subunit GpA-like protein